MIASPFSIFRPFEDRLKVALFIKEDDIRSDADAARALGIANTAGLKQMHGKRTVIINAPTNRTEEADGMITDVPDLALCTRWADCQNFVMYDPERNRVGVLHVGWKGLIAGAIPEFFTLFSEDPKNVLVGAGPSLCQQCADFTDPARELPSIHKKFVEGNTVDLRAAATEQMLSLGVLPKNVERHRDCTRCSPGTYWTYRGGDRDDVKNGHSNMLVCSLISLP